MRSAVKAYRIHRCHQRIVADRLTHKRRARTHDHLHLAALRLGGHGAERAALSLCSRRQKRHLARDHAQASARRRLGQRRLGQRRLGQRRLGQLRLGQRRRHLGEGQHQLAQLLPSFVKGVLVATEGVAA